MAICNCSLKSGQIQEDFHRFYHAISIDVVCWNNLRCWRSQLWQVDYTEEWWKEWPMRWHGCQHGCQWRTCAYYPRWTLWCIGISLSEKRCWSSTHDAYHGHSNKLIVKVAKIPEDVLEKGMSQEDFLAYFTITLPKYEIDLKPLLCHIDKNIQASERGVATASFRDGRRTRKGKWLHVKHLKRDGWGSS